MSTGYYTTGGTGCNRTAQVKCEQGYYCSGGKKSVCDVGSYSLPAGGESLSACSGTCTAGYYCPWISASPTQVACGGPQFYCPLSSAAPRNVPVGNYSTGGLPTTMTGKSECEAGTYCTGGVSFSCAAGRYGSVRGATNATYGCSNVCPPGYYCPAGSANGTAHGCSDARQYCAQGSGAPKVTPTGYYAVRAANSTTVYSSVLQCYPGTYCFGGGKFPCLAGSYGDSFGASNPTCSAKVCCVRVIMCALISLALRSALRATTALSVPRARCQTSVAAATCFVHRARPHRRL